MLGKSHPKNFWGVEKSNVGNRLKRVLAKFGGCTGHVRGVNGRSKFHETSKTRAIFTEMPLDVDVDMTAFILYPSITFQLRFPPQKLFFEKL